MCGGIIGVDRFVRSQSRQSELCCETEVEVEVVYNNVIERYGTKESFRCRNVITYIRTENFVDARASSQCAE